MARSFELEVPGLGTVTLNVAAGAGTVRVPVTLLGITRTATMTAEDARRFADMFRSAADQASGNQVTEL